MHVHVLCEACCMGLAFVVLWVACTHGCPPRVLPRENHHAVLTPHWCRSASCLVRCQVRFAHAVPGLSWSLDQVLVFISWPQFMVRLWVVISLSRLCFCWPLAKGMRNFRHFFGGRSSVFWPWWVECLFAAFLFFGEE